MGHHSNIVGGKSLEPKTRLERKGIVGLRTKEDSEKPFPQETALTKIWGEGSWKEQRMALWENGKFENGLCLSSVLSKASQIITAEKKWDRNGSVEVLLESCARRSVWDPENNPDLTPTYWTVLPRLLGWRLYWSQARPSQYGTITYHSSWKLPGTEDTFNFKILTN